MCVYIPVSAQEGNLGGGVYVLGGGTCKREFQFLLRNGVGLGLRQPIYRISLPDKAYFVFLRLSFY